MATYPSFPQLRGTDVRGLSGKELKRATNGTPRIKTYYTTTKREIVIVHELSKTDWNTLESFYNTNANISLTFLYSMNNTNYTCYFADFPIAVPKGAGYYDVVVNLIEA